MDLSVAPASCDDEFVKYKSEYKFCVDLMDFIDNDEQFSQMTKVAP